MKQIQNSNQIYDSVISLGGWCEMAIALKKQGLRSFSGPFDWVAGQGITARTKMLCHDMRGYLNQKDLKFSGKVYKPALHDIYFNQKTGISFLHDFPMGRPLHKTFPSVSAKYQRRIQTVLNLLSRENKILLTFMDIPGNNKKITLTEIQKCADELNQHFRAKIDLLYIHCLSKKAKGYSLMFDGRHTYYAECYLAQTATSPFDDDLCAHLLSNFHSKDEEKNRKYFTRKRFWSKVKKIIATQKTTQQESYWRILGIKCFRQSFTGDKNV